MISNALSLIKYKSAILVFIWFHLNSIWFRVGQRKFLRIYIYSVLLVSIIFSSNQLKTIQRFFLALMSWSSLWIAESCSLPFLQTATEQTVKMQSLLLHACRVFLSQNHCSYVGKSNSFAQPRPLRANLTNLLWLDSIHFSHFPYISFENLTASLKLSFCLKFKENWIYLSLMIFYLTENGI